MMVVISYNNPGRQLVLPEGECVAGTLGWGTTLQISGESWYNLIINYFIYPSAEGRAKLYVPRGPIPAHQLCQYRADYPFSSADEPEQQTFVSCP